MKIKALTVEDYMAVRRVRIEPDAERALILIGGKNGAGKSSTIRAFRAAFGSAKEIAKDPVRHGAKRAKLLYELDNGIVIEREIEPDGATRLIVRDADGLPMRRPQELLDDLRGSHFINPVTFLRLKAKEQRAELMRIIPNAAEIERIDEQASREFKLRTEVGRKLTDAQGELARLPPAAEPLVPIDVEALVAEERRFGEERRALDAAENMAAQRDRNAWKARTELDAALERVRRLQAELAAAQQELVPLGQRADETHVAHEAAARELAVTLEAWNAAAPRRAEVDREVARAGEHNRQVGERDAQIRRRKETAAAAAKLIAQQTSLSESLAAAEERKKQILAAAQLPVAGIELAEEEIRVGGVPLAQAASSEQMRIALAVAIAHNPKLDDVWVEDGALFDEASLELIAKHAEAAGKRVWVERVGTRDPGVIVIEDGQVML